MNVADADRVKDRFSTVYITIVSIFLGLAMEDLYSKFGSIEEPDFYSYVIVMLVSLLVINLWIAYSNMAISIRLIPIPMDAFMVFGSSWFISSNPKPKTSKPPSPRSASEPSSAAVV